MSPKLLNLGCGGRFHEDWTNVDMSSKDPRVIVHDLRKKLPFADGSFDMVYHSHVLEHFTKKDGERLMSECYRVLKPGGIIRIAVPDLERIAREYLVQLDKVTERSEANREWMTLELFDQMVRNKSGGEMSAYLLQKDLPNEDFIYERVGEEARNFRRTYLNKVTKTPSPSAKNSLRKMIKMLLPTKMSEALQIGTFRQGGEVHQWMYDRVSLAALLGKVGFADSGVTQATKSKLAGFEKYHLDTQADGTIFKPDSLFMEAIKKD